MRKQDLDNWLNSVGAEAEASAVDTDAPRMPQNPGGLADLWQPSAVAAPAAPADVAERLLERGKISAEFAAQARTLLKQTPGKRLSDVLIELGADEVMVQEVVAELAGVPFERIDPATVNERLLNKLTVEYCKTNGVMPLREAGARIVVGVTDPRRLFMLDEVRRRLARPLKVVLVAVKDVAAVIESLTKEQVADSQIDGIIKDIEEDDVEIEETKDESVDLEKQAAESPVIRFVNYLIFDAVKNGASDIHVEPEEKKLRIRYRIDGILHEMMNPPHSMHAAIVSRLKIMANLDISERRLPQDGRIRGVIHGRKLDLRLSTLPTGAGEKAVMRILDSRSVQVKLDDLGMPADTLEIWKHQIDQPHGIILVTGPTGSGKTTTLYASLSQMDRNRMNISTVEDPIEYHLQGINQVQVHEKIGMTFSAALRSLLRQDPDVVMVGEIRDDETARIAVQASLTGHLVLSTLHTNDAPSSITRLINIGVEPYLISAAVNAVLAQRLVRRICPHCKRPVNLDEKTADHLAMHGIVVGEIFEGAGCAKCHNTGYAGRVGLYEMLVLDDHTRDAVVGRPNVTEFRRLCIERGMTTLRADGFRKVAEGRTTIEEVMRVTHATI
jgi:type IV pilus assembly protein PilB